MNKDASPNPRGREDFAAFIPAIVEAVRGRLRDGARVHRRGLAKRYRVSEDKVRGWIRAGLLKGINTADVACGKPRYIVLPEALVEFERVRSTAPLPKVPRRRRPSNQIDFFPDSDAA